MLLGNGLTGHYYRTAVPQLDPCTHTLLRQNGVNKTSFKKDPLPAQGCRGKDRTVMKMGKQRGEKCVGMILIGLGTLQGGGNCGDNRLHFKTI